MDTQELDKKANEIREDIIKMLTEAKSGHSAGSLGMADVFTALYLGGVMKHNPKKPDWEERDRLILSNAHICPVMYAAMARAGYFPVSELKTLRKLGSRLQGHPNRLELPGLETSGGSLGQGLSIACGMAYSFSKIDKKDNWVWCLGSDGEHNEGQVWEAVMFAGKYRLFNLTQIMDRNNIQIDGYTEDVMPIEPLKEKYEAFGWHVLDVDGHNIREIIDACNKSKAIFEKPTLIIAHTIPGKGVDFIEWEYSWHGKTPCPEEAKKALACLRTLGGKIKSEND
ncbi:transketolase [Patescibacteria group bacterium]|nr:transketolase [Patescibacteria group bacterium]MBU2579353.1 transketolase [Patescibacteria group bacterium]